LDTTNWSGGDPSLQPKATRSARPSTALNRWIPSRSGYRTWLSAAKLTSASNWAPAARSTRVPAAVACAAAASNSTVLPTPASPDSRSAPPPTAAWSTNERRNSTSLSRPISGSAEPFRGTPPPPNGTPPRTHRPDFTPVLAWLKSPTPGRRANSRSAGTGARVLWRARMRGRAMGAEPDGPEHLSLALVGPAQQVPPGTCNTFLHAVLTPPLTWHPS
jgi:hypothetical protein